MTNTFNRANERLLEDLSAYIAAIRDFVSAYPRAVELCDMVIKEATLARALVAFASGPDAQDLSLRIYRYYNRWPYREQPYKRTQGFANEISEAKELREEATRLLDRIKKARGDSLMLEVLVCFDHIILYLDEEIQMLEESHQRIQPYVSEMDLIRKRLDLLIAALDARLPKSGHKVTVLKSYREAATILHEWEHGVPLDQDGLEILQQCLLALTTYGDEMATVLGPIRLPGGKEPPSQEPSLPGTTTINL